MPTTVTPVATPAGIAAVNDILKEVWVSSTLTSQLYDDIVLFDYIADVKEYTDSDGLRAAVPLKTGRTGGVGSRAIGQRLPDADRQKVAKAVYNYTNHYLQVQVLGPVVARMETDRQACVREVDFEVTNGVEDLKRMISRQLNQDGTGNLLLAGLPGNASSVVIPLGAANFGVLDRGWLYEGMVLDIGTAASPTLDASGVRIVTIDDNPLAPTITVDFACVITAGSTISLYGNRTAGAVSNEMNGLGNLVSATSTLGGLAPATNSYWKAVILGNAGVPRALTIDLMMTTLRGIRQKGEYPDIVHCDLKQEQEYYKLMQGQIRYMGDKDLNIGNSDGLAFARLQVKADPEATPGKMRFLKKDALQMFSSGDIAWQNQTTGGDVLAWRQDFDAFVGRAAKYCQLGTDRRRSLASLDDLL